MSDEKEDPREDAGPGSLFPVADGGVAADPTPVDEGVGDKLLPPPRYET